MRSQGGTKKVSFFSVPGRESRRRRTPRLLFLVGMSEYAPKLIFFF